MRRPVLLLWLFMWLYRCPANESLLHDRKHPLPSPLGSGNMSIGGSRWQDIWTKGLHHSIWKEESKRQGRHWGLLKLFFQHNVSCTNWLCSYKSALWWVQGEGYIWELCSISWNSYVCSRMIGDKTSKMSLQLFKIIKFNCCFSKAGEEKGKTVVHRIPTLCVAYFLM